MPPSYFTDPEGRDPRPAGQSLKPHTVTTLPPPMAATLLRLTHHPKHYHKLLPGCQATHTVELTVQLCSACPCKDSSVWGEKVELVARSKRLVMMAFYTRRKNLLWCFIFCGLWFCRGTACGTDSQTHCNNSWVVFKVVKKCVLHCELFETCHKVCVPHVFYSLDKSCHFCVASASVKTEESIEGWLRRPHTHGVTVMTGSACLFA